MRRELALLVLLGLTTGRAGTAREQPVAHGALDEILRATVRDEGVNYVLMRERFLDRLDGYLASMAALDPAQLGRGERLALYINVYNATVLRAVGERYRPGYSVAEDDYALFKQPLVRIGGNALSLDALENRIVRPEFSEPRIHAALCCAARSCPPLLGRAFTGRELEQRLESRMRSFVSDPRRNRIDDAARTLELSRIFEWYADDFGGPQAVSAYVDRFTERRVAGYEVTFLPYSWELNDASAP